MNLIWAVILLLLALIGVTLRKTYFSLPLKELQRRAAGHDENARRLYRAAAYGNSLRLLLWLYIGLTSAASFILLARNLAFWLSLIIIGAALWVAFSLLPASRMTKAGLTLTRLATPLITWLLNYLHPVLDRLGGLAEGHYGQANHTGLYEREDLLNLLKRQLAQGDNRLDKSELRAARHALRFSQLKVTDALTPRRALKSILASDTIGPVVIDELHKNGQPYAIVRESSKGPIVGIMPTTSLGLGSSGQAKDAMYAPANYLHEDDSLKEALQAFTVNNQPAFIVINSFEEYVGLINVKAVLEKLVGSLEQSEFDNYSDPSAVAARHNQAPVNTETEMVE